MNKIVVRVNIGDIIRLHDFDHWGDWLGQKLRGAGIPANRDGSLDSGRLLRYDDPTSWGVTVYEWHPGDAAVKQQSSTKT